MSSGQTEIEGRPQPILTTVAHCFWHGHEFLIPIIYRPKAWAAVERGCGLPWTQNLDRTTHPWPSPYFKPVIAATSDHRHRPGRRPWTPGIPPDRRVDNGPDNPHRSSAARCAFAATGSASETILSNGRRLPRWSGQGWTHPLNGYIFALGSPLFCWLAHHIGIRLAGGLPRRLVGGSRRGVVVFEHPPLTRAGYSCTSTNIESGK